MRAAPTASDRQSGGLAKGLARHWKSTAFVVATATALAVGYAKLSTPLYHAETRILVEAGQSDAAEILDGKDLELRIQTVLMPENLSQVAAELGLARLPEFDATVAAPLWSRLLVVAGLKVDPNETPAEERVLGVLREKLAVHGVADSRVIVIEMSSRDAELAAAIPNALAEIYLAGPAALPQKAGGLDAEIAGLTARATEAEARLAEFRAQPGVLVSQNKALVAARQLESLTDELVSLRTERSEAEATVLALREALKRGGSLDALPEVGTSLVLQQLREQRLQLKASIADLSVTLLDNHPRLRAVRSQLADLDRQIRTEGQRALDALDQDAKAAQLREDKLVLDIEALKVEAAAADEQTAKLQGLEREAKALRELLDAYASRQGVPEGPVTAAATAHIFARAQTPSEPYFPKVVPIAGAAFAASLLAMTLLTLLIELTSRRPQFEREETESEREPIEELSMPDLDQLDATEEAPTAPEVDIETPVTELEPVAAEPDPTHRRVRRFVRREPIVVPPLSAVHEDWEKHQPANDETKPPRPSKQAGLLATAIRIKGSDEMPASFSGELGIEGAAEKLITGGALRAIFVSPEGDEAAAASILVAREVADTGLRVLLLDLTASGAASWPMLESLSYFGITNLLVSEAQFTDVIHQDHFSECHVMPVGTADPARAMRAADRLPIIMDSLTTAYDLVVVECGPANAAGIRRLVGDNTEVLVSVIDTDPEIVAAANELKASGYNGLTMVTPAGYRAPNPPVPGRSAA